MDLQAFKKWVLKEFKIDLTAYKEVQLHRRLNSLLSRVGLSSFDEYIKLLSKDKIQRQKFLDFITINVTEFFRNPELFEDLNQTVKKELIDKNKNIKVWSAACSIGAEPYSIAILLDNMPYRVTSRIIATDLDATILKKAQEGIYSASEVKNVKKEFINKYFKIDGEKYIISDKIKNMVEFKKHDLILDTYDNNFDLIVCRNVVIYFNQDIKDKIYKKFSNALKKDGLLFVGATESIYNYKDYGLTKASTFIYRKL